MAGAQIERWIRDRVLSEDEEAPLTTVDMAEADLESAEARDASGGNRMTFGLSWWSLDQLGR
ncbi:hypothetical protein [Nisaea denitrificans]|uniref:hypothetical protein n=1 Tax=Nisaea denitrificans TaxID=390877 RepID=UPI0003FB2E1C|nr:hypothetical protein [Nisaea denitrificans]